MKSKLPLLAGLVAIMTSVSAQSPAISPSVASNAAPSKANTRIHRGAANSGRANASVTMNTPRPTTSPRTMDEAT